MKATTGLILLTFIVSCNNEAKKQAEQKQLEVDSLKLENVKQLARQQRTADSIKAVSDALLLEKKRNILMHLNEYCQITPQIESEGLGGFKAGQLYIRNNTGYVIDRAV